MGGNCSALSSKAKEEALNKNHDKLPDFLNEPDDEGSVRRILLLGPSGSGKTTLMKQMIQLYGPGFSEEVRLAYVPRIIYAVCATIHELVEQGVRLRLQFPDRVQLSDRYLNDAELLSTIDGSLSCLTPEVVAATKRLWVHPVTKYVLVYEPSYVRVQAQGLIPSIEEIASELYIPTFQDILYLYEPSNGITTSAALLDLRLPGEYPAERYPKMTARSSTLKSQTDPWSGGLKSSAPPISRKGSVNSNPSSIITNSNSAMLELAPRPIDRNRRSSVASAAENASVVVAEAIARIGDPSLLMSSAGSPFQPEEAVKSAFMKEPKGEQLMKDPYTLNQRRSVASLAQSKAVSANHSQKSDSQYGDANSSLVGTGERRSIISKAPVMLVDVGGAQSERHKWLHAFKNVSAIIFVAASDDYDEVSQEDPTMTKMQASIELFTEVFHSNWTGTVPILLFLTKIDSLPAKLEQASLSVSFPGYIPYAQRYAEEVVLSSEMIRQNKAIVQNNEGSKSGARHRTAPRSSANITAGGKSESRYKANSTTKIQHGKSEESNLNELYESNMIRIIGGDDEFENDTSPQSNNGNSKPAWCEIENQAPNRDFDTNSELVNNQGSSASATQSESTDSNPYGSTDSEGEDINDDESSIYNLIHSHQDETASYASAKTFIIRPQVFQRLLSEGDPEQRKHLQALQKRLQQRHAHAKKIPKKGALKFDGLLEPAFEREEDDEDVDEDGIEEYQSRGRAFTASDLGLSSPSDNELSPRQDLDNSHIHDLSPGNEDFKNEQIGKTSNQTVTSQGELKKPSGITDLNETAINPFHFFGDHSNQNGGTENAREKKEQVKASGRRTKNSQKAAPTLEKLKLSLPGCSQEDCSKESGGVPTDPQLGTELDNEEIGSNQSETNLEVQLANERNKKKILVKELHAALVYIRERFWGKIKEESSASVARRQSCCASLLDTEQVTVVAMSLERILSYSTY